MGRRTSPLFLERGSYRLRRLLDAVRLLVFVGAGLWMIPLLWPSDGAGAVPMSRALLYVFSVWALLIVAAGLLVHRMPQSPEQADAGEGAP
ncbi:hypothetical protein [uncultured Roseobacter sp.]|uniref:hypothetical protein n=1 Tax=uncultured Roseobacter sp. TaxID=114847 RepID=UPI00260F2173|nr:hypothetical protein [uncultured Roseobacter sp.]